MSLIEVSGSTITASSPGATNDLLVTGGVFDARESSDVLFAGTVTVCPDTTAAPDSSSELRLIGEASFTAGDLRIFRRSKPSRPRFPDFPPSGAFSALIPGFPAVRSLPTALALLAPRAQPGAGLPAMKHRPCYLRDKEGREHFGSFVAIFQPDDVPPETLTRDETELT